MTPPTLTTARLTLGPITPAHAGAFIAFCATDASRFIGGPADQRDAWEGAAICAGLWALRGHGPAAGSIEVRLYHHFSCNRWEDSNINVASHEIRVKSGRRRPTTINPA